MNPLSLEEFIYQVKRELLEAQEKHEEELAFLELQNVEIEVSLAVTKEANGKVTVYVAEIGSDVSREQAQRVRLAFNVIDVLSDAAPQAKAIKASAIKKTSRRVKRGGRLFPT
jgi:hypothetical protein